MKSIYLQSLVKRNWESGAIRSVSGLSEPDLL